MENFFFQFPCQTSPVQYFSQEKFEFLHKYHRSECQECFEKVIQQAMEKAKIPKEEYEKIKKNFFKVEKNHAGL